MDKLYHTLYFETEESEALPLKVLPYNSRQNKTNLNAHECEQRYKPLIFCFYYKKYWKKKKLDMTVMQKKHILFVH